MSGDRESIIFWEASSQIRDLFNSYWGIEKISNPFLSMTSERQLTPEILAEVKLLVIDRVLIQGSLEDWIKKIEVSSNSIRSRILWVVQSKEERQELQLLGIEFVIRFPSPISQWLILLKKMGFGWKLVSE